MATIDGKHDTRERWIARLGSGAVLGLLLGLGWTAARQLDAPSAPLVAQARAALPSADLRWRHAAAVQFEPNRGQAPAAVRYLSHGPTHQLQVFDDGLALSAPARADAGDAAAHARVTFVGAARAPLAARGATQARIHHLGGNDPARWVQDVPRYAQLRQDELYPGIDLVYYGRDDQLEFDLVVKPGADPAPIRMRVAAAQHPAIDVSGDLRLDGPDGALRLHRPVAYQNIDGRRRTVEGRYVMLAADEVGFRLADYDRSHALVIDPVFKLLYSTYLTGFHDDTVGSMVLDAQGNAYVVGQSNSDDFVVSGNAFQPGKSTTGLQYNVVVTKFDSSGAVVYSTYLGGTVSDTAAGIAVDAAGRAYITGKTTSHDFPTTAGAYQRQFSGGQSAYLSVLSPDGSTLAYSTFYSGAGGSDASAIALDASGAAVIAGTAGPGLPTTAGAYKTTLATGGASFVARFTPLAAGAPTLAAASYYGVDNPQANATLQGNATLAMALDANGAPWFTGQAFTTNLPLSANALQSAPPAMSSGCAAGPAPLNGFAFVAKLSTDLKTLAYASYLSGRTEPTGGTSCSEFGRSIGLDAAGDVYITGGTPSATFPVTAGALQPTLPIGSGFASYSSFLTKLKGDGSAILWSTYFGGNVGSTFPGQLVVDRAGGAVWLTTVTGGGSNFPLSVDALQPTFGGSVDAGVARFDSTTGALGYSTYLGGSAADVGIALGIDAGGNALLAGNTYSTNFPVTANARESVFRPDAFGGGDWFFSVLGNGVLGRLGTTSGSNTGDVTLRIQGAGLSDGSVCRLEGAQASIASSSAVVADGGDAINCTFALAGAAPGDYRVVVATTDGTLLKAPQAFSVEAGGGAQVWANVSGRAKVRVDTPARYEVVYGNRGAVNAYGVALEFSWPKDVAYTPRFELVDVPTTGAGFDASQIPSTWTIGERTHALLFIPVIPAGSTYTLPFELTAPQSVTTVDVQVATGAPMATSLAELDAAFGQIAQQAARAHALRKLPFADPTPAQAQEQCWQAAINLAINLAGAALPGGSCLSSVAGMLSNAVQTVQGHASPGASSGGTAMNLAQLGVSAAQLALDCTAAAIPGGQLITIGLHMAQIMLSAQQAADACKPQNPQGGSSSAVAGSIDPNDKTGPAGDGTAAHHIRAGQPFTYTVAFENLPAATLPAAQVVVSDTLDPAKFDLSTLTLGSIGWGSVRLDVPPGLTSYQTVHAIDATMSVRVQGSLDATTGALKWTFTTVDPATHLAPSDPTLGFLPPDTDGIVGQGYVTFTVQPKADLAEGTVWQNTASIVFDANAPIATPTWTNTLDTTPPTSRVQSLTPRVGTTSFDVVWSGSDTASGIGRYTVYVSDNGAAYMPWQANVTTTQATYDGQAGHTYGFYVVATDGAGNTEAAKSSAEATVDVTGNFPDTGSSGGGGGCSVNGNSRDASLPLLALAALVLLWRRRRSTQR